MGLMDKPKRVFDSEYVSIDDFLFYIAFTQEETVGDVASWLLYNCFSENINSYEVDRYYRVWQGKRKYGADKNIERFFNQITFDGYHSYFAYMKFMEEKGDDNNPWKDGFVSERHYKLVFSNFYLNIGELYKLDYIKKINVDFSKAKDYVYRIYLCDNIEAKPRSKNSIYHIDTIWCGNTLKESKKNREKVTPEQKETYKQQSNIVRENIRKVIEWAASAESIQEADEKLPKAIGDDIKEIITDKENYERLTPIQKYTFYMKNIVLPLARKIWTFDKGTNLLMRKQVARLVVELLPNFDLRENQVDDWLKQSNLVPTAITDRCAQHDYGNTKPEKEQREVIMQKIRDKVSPEIQSLIENAPKF